MTKVTPSERRRGVAVGTVAAGTVGLAAFSAVAGTVVAHAAENPVGLPLSTNAVGAVKGLMEHNHGAIAGLPMKGIPVVGDIPALLGVLPADKLPGLDGVDLASPADAVAPAMRARPLAAPVPHAAPSGTPAPIAAAAPQRFPGSQQAPKGGASPLDSVTGLTEMLPMKLPLGGLEKSLPVGTSLAGAQQGAGAQRSGGGLPLVGGLTGGLPGLGGAGGAGDLLGGLPLGGLTGGLSHLGG